MDTSYEDSMHDSGITILFWNVEDGQARITSGKYAQAECAVPREVTTADGTAYMVKEVAESAFAGHPSLQKVIVPEGVDVIGRSAFSECKHLENAAVYAKSIGQNAFCCCYSLKTATLPSWLKNIPEGCFRGCINLEKITLPAALERIERGAFANCETLQEITIPVSVVSIGDEAFSGCLNLKRVSLPEVMGAIGKNAFCDCESLESCVLPYDLTCLSDGTFIHCKSLREVTLPEGLKAIGDNAFYGCESLKSIVIPTTVKAIGRDAFKETNMEEITLPKRMEYSPLDHLGIDFTETVVNWEG